MPTRIQTVPESNRIRSRNNLPPTSTNSNTQAGTVMTTIIRDRTMLSDRITKWARRCFQNRYDCRGSQRSADATPKMPFIIIEIRRRVNSDDFETMIEARLGLSTDRLDYPKDLKINAKCFPSLPPSLFLSLLSGVSNRLEFYEIFRFSVHHRGVPKGH